jgi:hypothetical protein
MPRSASSSKFPDAGAGVLDFSVRFSALPTITSLNRNPPEQPVCTLAANSLGKGRFWGILALDV